MNLLSSSLQQLLNFFPAIFRPTSYTDLFQPDPTKWRTLANRSNLIHVRSYNNATHTGLSIAILGSVSSLLQGLVLKKQAISFVMLLFLIGCGKPLPTFENLDIAKWKEDKSACGKIRMRGMAELTKQKDKLKGLSQGDIVELLGRPDQNELYKRNQKFFYYLLTPGKECGSDSIAHRLSLRFNAMGFAKEVMIE